jgi:phytoene dehydrogenase-like protein
MGETDGVPGAWSYVEGGMGSISRAIAAAAADEGYAYARVEIH